MDAIRHFLGLSQDQFQQLLISLGTSAVVAALGLLGWGLKWACCKIGGKLRREPSPLAKAILMGLEKNPCLVEGWPAVEADAVTVLYGDHVERWSDSTGRDRVHVRNQIGTILVDGSAANRHLPARDVRLILRRAQAIAVKLKAERATEEREQMARTAMGEGSDLDVPSLEEIEHARERLLRDMGVGNVSREAEAAYAADSINAPPMTASINTSAAACIASRSTKKFRQGNSSRPIE